VARIKAETNSRLSRNFHRTFIPERLYLAKLLQYAATNGPYDMQAIAEATGIPTGVASGKALPTADYCLGMGLVRLEKSEENIRTLNLTPFGRIVYLSDRYFKDPLTQWIAHLRLCDPLQGAEVWYQTFHASFQVLGSNFSRDNLNGWLCTTMNVPRQNVIGPLISMYASEASFSLCGAIRASGSELERRKAPIDPAFAYGYVAWLVSALERNANKQAQISVSELEAYCGFRSLTGWTLGESQEVLALLERKGLAVVDRHMHPWSVSFRSSSDLQWGDLYKDCV